MVLHYSSVNFENLVKDLADMYTFPVSEVVLIELIANSLDAKALEIKIFYDVKERLLTVEDNGMGMSKNNFGEYHDFAAGLKKRGTGIGFAGLGAKISFNVASKVKTETFSSSFKGGSNWYLRSKKELVWEEMDKLQSLNHKGTKVQVYFDVLSPQNTIEDIKVILMRHFLSLLDENFLNFYNDLDLYSNQFRFFVNNQVIKPFDVVKNFKLSNVKKVFFEYNHKIYGYGLFGLTPEDFMVDTDTAGVGISVFGKIVKYDFFGQFPGEVAPKIFGLVEIPVFIDFLNTSKTDFIRKRRTARTFNNFYSTIRDEFKNWLKEIGIKPIEAINTEEAIKLEQEIKKLVKEIPELSNFFGGSNKAKILLKDELGDISSEIAEGTESTFPIGEGEKSENEGLLGPGEEPGIGIIESVEGLEKAKPISRRVRTGVRISFADNPERIDLAWLEDNTIVVNSGHGCYQKLKNNMQAKRVHNIYSIAIALNKELSLRSVLEDSNNFIDRMMSEWGKIK